MPDALREAMADEAAAPTKSEATAKALKGMRLESPITPRRKEAIPQPNCVAPAKAHHQWALLPPSLSPFSSISLSPLSLLSFQFCRRRRRQLEAVKAIVNGPGPQMLLCWVSLFMDLNFWRSPNSPGIIIEYYF